MRGASTRNRTSRLRHRKPVLCPAELWTRVDVEAPTGIEPVTAWVEARCSIRMSYGATKGSRLAWTVSNRSTSPMSRGRSAAELQANGCRARIRTWTNRGNSSARYRLTPRGSGGERGARTLAPAHVRRPTWVATRPRHQLGYLSTEEEGERVERSCRLNTSFRFRDGGPCQWAIPPCCERRLVQTGSNRRRPRCGRGALPLSYGPMTAARVMPCRGGGARSITRPSEPSDRHCTDCSRGRTLRKLRR